MTIENAVPIQHQVLSSGVELAVFEWGQPSADLPAVVFAHATGFHARVWDQVIARLPEFHCFAIDLRGHGRSGKPAPPYDWRLFAQDVMAVGQAFGLSGAVGVGHSLGGHAVTLAAALTAALQPALFSRLLLIDPVIFAREAYVGVIDFAGFVARRRNEWQSPDEMYERFKDRPPFNTFDPLVLRDYTVYGLLPNPNGAGYVLACAPEYEAASYSYGTAADIYAEIATVQIPVTILRARGYEGAGFDFSGSPTAPDVAAQFPNAVDVPLPQYSHFIPMEAPDVVADWVRKVAKDGD